MIKPISTTLAAACLAGTLVMGAPAARADGGRIAAALLVGSLVELSRRRPRTWSFFVLFIVQMTS